MSLKDYIIDSEKKTFKGSFISVCLTVWAAVWFTLAWIPGMPDVVIEHAVNFSPQVVALVGILVPLYWYKKYKEKELEARTNGKIED